MKILNEFEIEEVAKLIAKYNNLSIHNPHVNDKYSDNCKYYNRVGGLCSIDEANCFSFDFTGYSDTSGIAEGFTIVFVEEGRFYLIDESSYKWNVYNVFLMEEIAKIFYE